MGFEWALNRPSLLFSFRCSGCLVECGLIRWSRWWLSRLVDWMVWAASWPLWSSMCVSCQDGLVLLFCDRVELVDWQSGLPSRLCDRVEKSGWTPSALWSSRTAVGTASSPLRSSISVWMDCWANCFPLSYWWLSMLVEMWLSVLFFLFLSTNRRKTSPRLD